MCSARQICNLVGRFQKLPPLSKVVLVFSVVTATSYAQKGRTNATPVLASAVSRAMIANFDSPIVTEEDIDRGWQLWNVETNTLISYEMPPEASFLTNWWLRGAFEDVAQIHVGDNPATSLWVYVWGKIRPFLRVSTNELVAIGTPMSAIPMCSRLWYQTTTNNALLVTWENFCLNRDTNTLINAQVEWRTTGDFVIRSNTVERTYRHIDTFDWDGDGWHNEDDDEPFVCDVGDHTFGLVQPLPPSANTNAYYWIDIESDYNAFVSVDGDGVADLADPNFVLRASEPCRVILLVGRTYSITASRPVHIADCSDSGITINGDGTENISVVWPVSFTTLEGNGRCFRMLVSPSFLNGVFSWTDTCCSLYGNGSIFRYGCGSKCNCDGCCASGEYAYEGYSLPCTGGWCGCDTDNGSAEIQPRTGVTANFSKRVIIFEDDYESSPNVFKSGRSTDTELAVTVHGGVNGGFVAITMLGADRLVQTTGRRLPLYEAIQPHVSYCFTNRYTAVEESVSNNDIVATATFVENETGWADFAEAKMTSVRVEIRAKVDAPENDCRGRHKYGVCEEVECLHYPDSATVAWTCCDGGHFKEEDGACVYHCPTNNSRNGLSVSCGEVVFRPETMVVVPSGIVARNPNFISTVAPGEAGGILLIMELYVSPFDVSFQNVQIEEVPDAGGSHTGYFADSYFMREWLHGVNQGAGAWYSVLGDNRFLVDNAGVMASLPQIDSMGNVSGIGTNGWCSGTLIWNVPYAWRSRSADEQGATGLFSVHSTQSISITQEGDCTVEKHANTVTRCRNGDVSLNGSRQ